MKINTLCLLVSLFTILFSSCSSDETYSCDKEADAWAKENLQDIRTDKEADAWAKENLQDIRTMTRGQWSNVGDATYQKAAYAAFTPEQKYTFWLQKVDEILSLGWSENEKEHIYKMKTFLIDNPNLFTPEYRTDESEKTLDIMFYKWGTYGKDHFGWDNKLIAAMFTEGFQMVDKNGTLDIKQRSNDGVKLRSEGNNCDCREKEFFTTCSLCYKPNCVVIEDCGLFWNYNCDGICVY